jgi:hypothetical protein
VSGRPPSHLPPETLQAYAAGEVDPALRRAVESHLEGCPACRARLARVQGIMAVFPRGAPAGAPDELTWRRLRQRVRAQLEEDAARGHGTLDIFLGRRWVPAAVAAVAAVAVIVWLSPRPRPPAPAPVAAVVPAVPTAPADEVRRVLTEDAPATLTLASGVELSLEVRSELLIYPGPGGLELVLSAGRLGLRDPRPVAPDGPSVQILVGAHRVMTRGATLDIERVGEQADVFVHAGQVLAAQDGGIPRPVPAGAVETLGAAAPRLVTAPRRRRPGANLPPSEPKGSLETASAAPPSGAPPAPEVSVVVEAPTDPLRRTWIEARAAYYRDGDLDRAIGLAEGVRAQGRGRPEAQWADGLLCEAYTAARRPHEAVAACTAVLPGLQGEEARMLHRRLAEVYRMQLDDCTNAIIHYNRVLVFGGASPLDDGTRLARAECAVEVGDWNLAARDLAQLERVEAARGASTAPDRAEHRAAVAKVRERMLARRSAQAGEPAADSR